MNPETFAALAHDVRLTVFRLLLAKSPDGLPAGQIAQRLEIPASTLSTHLAQLERAGLLRSWREQRRILYAVDVEGTRRLVGFLVDDCCGGAPELCGIGRREERKTRRRGDKAST
ncbi:MAG TPA: metalloregulator ArsR/SmtB family transcription factor [Gammaproteobacteria bacterium]|nr:metalloregulator ArsR/SmtB family transcription factor [Gammaproteobacteria bacterium]